MKSNTLYIKDRDVSITCSADAFDSDQTVYVSKGDIRILFCDVFRILTPALTDVRVVEQGEYIVICHLEEIPDDSSSTKLVDSYVIHVFSSNFEELDTFYITAFELTEAERQLVSTQFTDELTKHRAFVASSKLSFEDIAKKLLES